MEIVDEDSMTVLHLAIQCQNYTMVHTTINYFEEQVRRQDSKLNSNQVLVRVQDFLHKRIKNGFTSIHLAAFNGNLEVLRLLV
jgi:ankyrin repeat protein